MSVREHGYMQLGVVGERLRIIQDGHDVTQNFMGLPLAVKVSGNEFAMRQSAKNEQKKHNEDIKQIAGEVADKLAAIKGVPEAELGEIPKPIIDSAKKRFNEKKKARNE